MLSFRWRTVLGVALIEAALLLVLITVVLQQMREASEYSLQRYAETTAALFARTAQDAVLGYDLATLESLVAEIVQEPEVGYVRILRDTEMPLAEAGEESLLQRTFKEDKESALIQDAYYDITWPIEVGGRTYGWVQLGVSDQVTTAHLRQARDIAVTLAVAEMVLVAVFSLLLGTLLTRRLRLLRDAAQQISRGDLEFRTPAIGSDEIGEVGESFNRMADQLKLTRARRDQYQQQLESLNQELEDRVKRRTGQLTRKNMELAAAYENLQSAQKQLVHAEKLASLGQLSAGVAHEINNPIAFIKGNLGSMKGYLQTYQAYTEFLESSLRKHQPDLLESEEYLKQRKAADIEFIQQDPVQLIEESLSGIDRVSGIVQGLKEYARSDQSGISLENLNDCIEATYRIAASQLKYQGEVVLDLEPIPPFYFNRGKISQVIMNLLVNAGQAIEDKGEIRVTAREEDGYVEIMVIDNGCGISPEHLDKLFDPFFTTKAVGEGTGLGLAISQGIVQDHRGSIRVESEPGRGTAFRIRLPALRDQPEES